MVKLVDSVPDAIERVLGEKLKSKVHRKLDKETCTLIYQDIFYALSEIFEGAGTPLDNEAVNLLSQMYYDSVTVNGGQELDPNIFTQRAQMSNIPTKQLALMATMTSKTPMASIFISEIKRRQ